MKKFRVGILIILVAVVGFVVWYNASQKVELPTTSQPLRIGLNPWIGDGVYYVAQDQGFFAKEKVAVEFVTVDDEATGRQLLQTGKIDILYLPANNVVVPAAAGVKVKVVAANDRSNGADGIVAVKNIQKIEDLKGKTVAFEVGSTSHFLLSYLLDKSGLTTKDMTVVNSIAPDAGAAFVAGKVDAAVTWEPWLSQASHRSGGDLLASSKDAAIVFDMPIFRAEIVEQRREEVKALLRATFAAREWINKYPTEAVKIIAKNFKISEADAMEQIKGVYWLSYQDNLAQLTTGEFSVQNSIQKAGDLWFKLGLIKTKVSANEIVDSSILKDLYK